MRTSNITIENIIRHFANKMNIIIKKIDIKYEESYEYEVEDDDFDETNNTFSIALEVDEKSSIKSLKNFIGRTEWYFTSKKKYQERNESVFIYTTNVDLD